MHIRLFYLETRVSVGGTKGHRQTDRHGKGRDFLSLVRGRGHVAYCIALEWSVNKTSAIRKAPFKSRRLAFISGLWGAFNNSHIIWNSIRRNGRWFGVIQVNARRLPHLYCCHGHLWKFSARPKAFHYHISRRSCEPFAKWLSQSLGPFHRDLLGAN